MDKKKTVLAEFDKDEGFPKCKVVIHKDKKITLEPLENTKNRQNNITAINKLMDTDNIKEIVDEAVTVILCKLYTAPSQNVPAISRELLHWVMYCSEKNKDWIKSLP